MRAESRIASWTLTGCSSDWLERIANSARELSVPESAQWEPSDG